MCICDFKERSHELLGYSHRGLKKYLMILKNCYVITTAFYARPVLLMVILFVRDPLLYLCLENISYGRGFFSLPLRRIHFSKI